MWQTIKLGKCKICGDFTERGARFVTRCHKTRGRSESEPNAGQGDTLLHRVTGGWRLSGSATPISRTRFSDFIGVMRVLLHVVAKDRHPNGRGLRTQFGTSCLKTTTSEASFHSQKIGKQAEFSLKKETKYTALSGAEMSTLFS